MTVLSVGNLKGGHYYDKYKGKGKGKRIHRLV